MFEMFLHLDTQLQALLTLYGGWTYAILFLLVFIQTAIVIVPIPGNSLLFTTGALASQDGLNIGLLFVVFVIAASLGDLVNYWIGAALGPTILNARIPLLRRAHLERTHAFYEQYGGKTLVLARFVPIVRSLAPFVAGTGRMTYRKFLSYTVLGNCLWVATFVLSGYSFRRALNVHQISLPIIVLALCVLLPLVYHFFVRPRFAVKSGIARL